MSLNVIDLTLLKLEIDDFECQIFVDNFYEVQRFLSNIEFHVEDWQRLMRNTNQNSGKEFAVVQVKDSQYYKLNIQT